MFIAFCLGLIDLFWFMVHIMYCYILYMSSMFRLIHSASGLVRMCPTFD
jgi:hypothetical protein